MLQNRFSAGELQGETETAKVKRIYPCTFQDEFEDLTEVKQQAHTWSNLTVVQRQGPEPIIPSEWKDAVKYLRQMFSSNRYYSLPQEVWNLIYGNRRPDHATYLGQSGGPLLWALGE